MTPDSPQVMDPTAVVDTYWEILERMTAEDQRGRAQSDARHLTAALLTLAVVVKRWSERY